MKLRRFVTTFIATAAVTVASSSLSQKTNSPDSSSVNAIDRSASAYRNLQDVQQGISDRQAFIDREKFQIRSKQEHIKKLSKAGNMSEAKIREMEAEIKTKEASVENAERTQQELYQAKRKYEKEIADAENDLRRTRTKEANENPPNFKRERKEVQRRFLRTEQRPNHSSSGGSHTVRIYRVVYDNGTSEEVEE